MNETLFLIFILIIVSIAETLALTSLEKYNITRNKLYFLGGVGMYVVICFMLVYLFQYGKLAIVNSLWNGISMIMVVFVGYFIFKNALTVNEIVAVILIIMATLLVSVKDRK